MKKKSILLLGFLCAGITIQAQKVHRYTTTRDFTFRKEKASLSKTAEADPVLKVDGNERGVPFVAWGTTFNELDWDAFNLLSREEQDEVMRRIYAPDGDLRFTRGRVSMNAND